ncbi:MAG TPA: carboxypeptidase-like regulatory domain-containing protein, partial [Agriterribacter sp.]|nr:carboxypeptidase-like regulatory domain-containing protein [Agriterribacter sp.]
MSLLVIAFLFTKEVAAQDITVTGTVADETGAALSGASVVNKETGSGTTTDADGKYSIRVNGNTTLVFSSSGFTSQEMNVRSRRLINITLSRGAQSLSEVVVTALGISREKKALGYSVGEVTSDMM